MQEQVERARHHALGGVLHAHHAELRSAGGRGVEHLVEAVAVDQVGGAAEEFDGSLLAERALRTKHRHALRHFQCQAGGHDLAPDGGHVLVQQRPWVGGLYLLDDLRHAIGAEKRRAFFALEVAHLFGHSGALIQQRQQLGVQAVDLHPKPGQCFGLDGRWRTHGIRMLRKTTMRRQVAGAAWGEPVSYFLPPLEEPVLALTMRFAAVSKFLAPASTELRVASITRLAQALVASGPSA